MSKQCTITLSGRTPVRIDEDAWPVIARADGDSYAGLDYGRRQQALGQGELDIYALRVRRHTDGRAIVHAILDGATAWTGTESRRGGELLDADADIVAAIRRVGEDCALPDGIVRGCIADLPAQQLD